MMVFVAILLAGAAAVQDAPGLIATYRDADTRVNAVVRTPNFFLESGESIHPAIAPAFRAQWAASITILEAGGYEFDPAVTIGGKSGTTFALTPGKQSFALSVDRATALRLRWRSNKFDWEPVPASAFSHPAAAAPDPLIPRGRALANTLGCRNCHGISTARHSLRTIGTRSTPAWLNAFLARHTIPLEAARRADAAAYLSTLRSKAQPKFKEKPSGVDTGKGGELFGTIGCAACHTLRGLGSKYTFPILAEYILAEHRPSTLVEEEEAAALAAYLMRSEADAETEPAPPGDPVRGEAVVRIAGCLGCHSIDGLTSTARPAPALAGLRGAACKAARYDLDEESWRAIRAWLASPPERFPAPIYELPFQLAANGCLNCHAPDAAQAPALEGAGERLKASWLGAVLSDRKPIQAGLQLRMPGYRRELVEPWIAAFAKSEGLAPGDGTTPPPFTGAQRTAGLGLIGTNPATKGIGCIGCHGWGSYKSLGEQGPRLDIVTARMRFEWFERWMRDPARILSGTSMPNYFGAMAPDLAKRRIHALWAGLELGSRSPGRVPEGYRAF